MKYSTTPLLVQVIVQPLAMYLFIRVAEFGFFVSAGLAALVALLAGFTVGVIQTKRAGIFKSEGALGKGQ